MTRRFHSRRRMSFASRYGRIIRSPHGEAGPTHLSEDPGRRVVMCMGPGALTKVACLPAIEMLELIGYTPEYIRRKIDEGNRFHLAVFNRPDPRMMVANWRNTIRSISEQYPETAEILEANSAKLISTPFAEFEEAAGFSFEEIDGLGTKDPRYMDLERLLASDRSALSTRRFLYHVTRLTDLYTGNGMTMTDIGGRGVREYITRNRDLSELENLRLIELEI